jgi:hypothetical protein
LYLNFEPFQDIDIEVGDILSPRTKVATAFGPDLEEPHL